MSKSELEFLLIPPDRYLFFETPLTREWNGVEATKSRFCSVLEITLFFISPLFIILFTLFYHFAVIFYVFRFVKTNARPSGDSIPLSLVQESNALTITPASQRCCRKVNCVINLIHWLYWLIGLLMSPDETFCLISRKTRKNSLT